MPVIKSENFSTTLKKFKTKLDGFRTAKKERLVLIILSNTHDPVLCKGCEIDAVEIKNTFQKICEHTGHQLCCVEISGKNYSSKNLFKAFDSMGTENEVTVFYYSGHGYSYLKDSRYRYPQLDMRSHNNQPDFNKIDFIEQHTENLKALLLMMMWRAGRVNIAIADCCNTTIQFKRKKDSKNDMEIADDVMVRVSKKFTKQLYADNDNMVGILVSSSTQGQSSISDDNIGSIFTHHFTQTITKLLAKDLKEKKYFPWVKVLKTTTDKAFKESNTYDVGNGIAGKQNAIFEVFIESGGDYDKRMAKHGW